LIEDAYAQTALPVWTEDEAGPYPTRPHPGSHWQPRGDPARYPHEYVREGTAKQLTLFHPATGEVRVKGVQQCPNTVLHPWLQGELAAILATLPEPPGLGAEANRRAWTRWQEGLSVRITLPQDLPPLRLLLVWDNLAGHLTPSVVLWLFAHGVMPLYTPLGGSWLNMAESIQRILKRRALDGQHPKTPDEIIAWLEAAARGWNREPTPFAWGGARHARRQRARVRRHVVGGSGACTRRPLPRRPAGDAKAHEQRK
jgi:DDE superfamily endonuclease